MTSFLKKSLLFSTLLWLSCSSGPPVLFEISTESNFLVFAGLDNIQTHTWVMKNIRTNIDLLTEGIPPESVDAIFSREAIIEAPLVEFDFRLVNMVAINIWDPQTPNDKREVFFMDRRNNTTRERLPLFSSLSEVKDILLNPTFDAEVKIRFTTFTPTEIESRLTMNFVANGKE